MRIPFQVEYLGRISMYPSSYKEALFFLKKMQENNMLPILSDGYPAGNMGFLEGGNLYVTQSMRPKEKLSKEIFIQIKDFSLEEKKVYYYSFSSSIVPTSDTPLYWLFLVENFSYLKCSILLHGHSFPHRGSFPISFKEAKNSLEEYFIMKELIKSHPPSFLYIRKNHGFFLLEKDFPSLKRNWERYLSYFL